MSGAVTMIVSAMRLCASSFGVLLLACVPAARAGDDLGADESLARFVPADVGLCIEADGLHAKLESFLSGPLYERWRKYPPLAAFHAEQSAQLQKFDAVLKSKLGVSWQALRSQLFGRQWLLVVYPPHTEEQIRGRKPPDGFVLLRAADPDVLRKAADKLIEAKRADDDYVEDTSVEFAGRKFVIHDIRADENHIHFAYDGDFGCLATDEAKLREVLARYAASSADEGSAKDSATKSSLAATSAYRAARERLSPAAAVRAFVPTAAWYPYYKSLNELSPGGSEQEAKTFAEVWSNLESIAAGLELGATTRLELYVAWDKAKTSPEFRDQLARLATDPAAAAKIPGDALFALSAQLDMREVVELLMPKLRRDAEDKGRRVPTEAVLAARLAGGFGPGLTAYASAARAYDEQSQKKDDAQKPESSDAWPVDWVIGLDTQPIKDGEPDMAAVLDPLIRVGFVLAADAYNADRKPTAKVESRQVGNLEITGLTGLGSMGQAGVFVTRAAGRLWCGAGVDALSAAVQVRTEKSLAASELFRALHNPRRERIDHFVYLNFGEIRRTVAAVAENPPAWLADLKRESARAGVRELQALLSLADAALLEAGADDEGVAVSLALGVE